MSFAYGEEVARGTPFRHLVHWSWVWIGLLLVTKALDAVTTAVGLLLVPGFVEANPFAAAVLDAHGVLPGLLFLSLVTIGVVGSVTELGVRYLEGHDDAPPWGPRATRIVGYGPISIVFAAAALHNAGLIARVVLLG